MLRPPAAWIVLATIITPLILSAQAPQSPSASGPGAFLNSFSRYAQQADSSEGTLNYATKLIRLMTLHVNGGDTALLARRLALADQAARHDSGKYVQETAVAAAFNCLMAQVQDSHATPIRTNEQTVHSIRWVLATNSPALTSVKEHPASCLPDEAVLAVFLLILNNGKVVFVPSGQPLAPALSSKLAEEAANDAQIKLDQYLAAHSTASNMALFSRFLGSMGI